MHWIGPVIGAAVGIAGGLYGSYCSIRNTRGPREKGFVIRATLVCWLSILLWFAGMWLMPRPYKIWLIVLYAVTAPFAIHRWNRRQAAIREEEARRVSAEPG